MLTCWPVLTEAAWLLREDRRAVNRLLHWESEGTIRLLELGPHSLPWIAKFGDRFANLKPDLADAALAYLAEIHRLDTIFTLDRRDFTVYRLAQNRRLRLVPLPG